MRWFAKSALAMLALPLSTLLLAGCAAPTSGMQKIQAAQSDEYHVSVGDKIRVVVQDLKDLDNDYVVDETGAISFPMIKQVSVRDKTYREVELAVEDTLRNQKILVNPKVSVQPLDLRPLYILGEVNHPGQYAYRQGMTVFAAVSAAGGYTYRAKSGEVAVTRNVNGQPLTRSAREDSMVLPGDQIRVYERWF
ncbi:polysaccharide biosynthesis/export family protein [Novosphingobium lentum]|uniref:polysaccharide biosynthesis/export family protein n=1 Tax=Novosphingobium lentum TaxID=145287 RepID=UPI0008345AF4|nr:polysaccharide biosynthesis/export family protein [Novosphingobium lentum]